MWLKLTLCEPGVGLVAELVHQPYHWYPVPFLSNAVLNPAEEGEMRDVRTFELNLVV